VGQTGEEAGRVPGYEVAHAEPETARRMEGDRGMPEEVAAQGPVPAAADEAEAFGDTVPVEEAELAARAGKEKPEGVAETDREAPGEAVGRRKKKDKAKKGEDLDEELPRKGRVPKKSRREFDFDDDLDLDIDL